MMKINEITANPNLQYIELKRVLKRLELHNERNLTAELTAENFEWKISR